MKLDRLCVPESYVGDREILELIRTDSEIPEINVIYYKYITSILPPLMSLPDKKNEIK